MPLLVNLRHLQVQDVRLEGKLPVQELDPSPLDKVIQVNEPLEYELEVQQMEEALLAQGRLSLTLDCFCVRCLKPFRHRLELTHWAGHLPLTGEDAVPVVNDCVDLTPLVREDILLEFPQHPLCEPECGGLPKSWLGKPAPTANAAPADAGSSAWAALNKLKL